MNLKHYVGLPELSAKALSIFNYVEDFVEGRISREAFWELAKFKHPSHQICFNTAKALKTLRFLGGQEVTNDESI